MAEESRKGSGALKAPKGGLEKPAAPAIPSMPFQKRDLILTGVAFAVIWGLVIASGSKVAMIVLGVITVAIVGFGAYAWRWFNKQKRLIEIVQKGTESPEARKAALEELSAKGDKDTESLLARVRLEMEEDPHKALETLEKVDLAKVPSVMVDSVKVLKAQLYLLESRTREAADLADGVQIARIQQPDERVAAAGIVAEAWARSSKEKEAYDLLKTFSPDDEAYKKSRPALLIARIFTHFASSNRELARKDMISLAKENVMFLGRFLDPRFKVHPLLGKLAQEVAQKDPSVREMAMKMNRSQRRHPR